MAVQKAQKAYISVLTGVLLFTRMGGAHGLMGGHGAAAMKPIRKQRRVARVNATLQNAVCDGSGLSASVVRQGDANYDTARAQFGSVQADSATADARTKPQMIIFCSTDAHVQEAVRFATACGFTISVRSGGHNYAAYSSCPESSPQCIQVDLSDMETFSVDTSTTPAQVTIGAGLTLEQVYANLVPYGLAVPGGICKTVGVGGHYQTSAAGYYGRAFGLGLDYVNSFRIVMADGEVHTVNASSDPDLHWALLGGGAGSWGIVLDYTLDSFADADYPHFATFTFLYPYSRAMLQHLGAVYASQSADTLVERDLAHLFMVHPAVLFGIPGATNEHYIMCRFVWMGIDNGALTGSLYDTYVKPWEDVPHLTTVPFTSMPISVFPGFTAVDWDLGPFRYHIHSFGMDSHPTTEFYDIMADEMEARIAIPNLHFSWQINAGGGMLARNAGKNAVMVRNMVQWVDDWTFFLGDGLAQVAEDRIIAFREANGHLWEEDNIPHSYMTPDTLTNNTHSGPADFSMNESHFARLQSVKTRVDPTDLFHTELTIPPLASASAVGDPHLQNVHGERFDLMQAGWHTLIEIPRKAPAQRALLLVEAEARHDGSACADMYFQSLNITGKWAQEKQSDGLRFSAHDSDAMGSTWMTFGNVDLKVAHGHTLQGTRYLNFYVKRLAKAGFAIGGLLGEDDHTRAATPADSCQGRLSLAQLPSGRASSTAEASLM